MKLLDVKAVLDRDADIQQTDCDCVVLKELDDNSTRYAILSHRWGTEVGYEEMTELMKMEGRKRDKIRQRDGYQKIIKSCEQAMKDNYEWLWIDTCCIDKKSSSELSEAINSMYQWYRNAQVCYAYLHDVDGSTFPTQRNNNKFRESNGWPEWFVRGWTLQELIAPKQVEFFNKDWVLIGSKRRLGPTLQAITGIPFQVLRDGLASKRLSVAQIMSWAADRKTTRVEDRAYSLLGLFGVNMPMLYGEGSKAFRRLQLEIIRESNDHSIFAWNPRVLRLGSVLATSPRDFQDCHHIKKVEFDEFTGKLTDYIEENKLGSPSSKSKFLRADITIRRKRRVHQRKLAALRDAAHSQQLGTFSVSNAGIQVWLPVIPSGRNHLRAILACSDIFGHLVTIDLVSSASSFDRIFCTTDVPKTYPEFKTLYLTHQGANEGLREFTLDDNTASYHGFTRCGTFPREFTGNTVSLSSLTNDLILVVYADDDVRSFFAVGLGYCLGQGWVHITCDENSAAQREDWKDFSRRVYNRMWNARAEHARSMPKRREEGGYGCHSDNFIKHAHLPRSIYAARVVWGRWEMDNFKLMIDVEQCPGSCAGPCRWTATANDRHGLDMPGLMKTDFHSYRLKVDGWWVWFDECSGQKIALGDYGDYFSGKFKRDGNIYEDMRALGINATDPAYCPVASRISDSGYAPHHTENQNDFYVIRYGRYKRLLLSQPKGFLLPANEHFVMLLKALSTRLAGKHLVIAVIQSLDVRRAGDTERKQRDVGRVSEQASDSGNHCTEPAILTPLYSLASPQVWRREPVCAHRREQIKNIQEQFYTLLKMQPPGSKIHQKSAKLNGTIKFFSDMFGLKYLINYVGKITFFRRLSSMTETDSLSELFAGKREENALPACQSKSPIVSRVMPCNLLKGKGLSKDPCLEVIFPLLLRRCQILCRQDGVSRRYADTKQEIVHEVKSISQTLSASLLQHISATFARQMTDCASHLDYDRQLDPRSAVQEIMALQAKLNAVEDEDEQRALGEDVTGKILWFYWCGICVEVDELLPKVPNCIWREGVLEGLLEIRRIIEETHTEPGDDQAHLQRIMLDAGAGTSKHQLLLTARVAEQAKWSCATALGDASIREATPGASIQIPFTSVDNIGSTSTASRSN